jgi:gluconate 2-dehydrogenase
MLAFMNLLPIPALDGSHILFALIEFVRRKRIPVEREAMVHMTGFALLMACARRMSESERYLREGLWASWRYDFFAGAEVHGSTLGILGMGRIGQAVAKRASLGFGMQVLYHNRRPLPSKTERALNAQWVSRDELLERADHLMLVLPYSPEVHHTIGEPEIARMKAGSHLINIARGGLIDEDALADALESGHLAGAALDVFHTEPLAAGSALRGLDNVILTPHRVGHTFESDRSLIAATTANVQALWHGQAPPLLCNPTALPAWLQRSKNH